MAEHDSNVLTEENGEKSISEDVVRNDTDRDTGITDSHLEHAENQVEEIELKQMSKDEEIEIEVRKKSSNNRSRISEVVKSITEAQINYGLLYKVFKCCCPNSTAVFIFILVTLILNTSDAFSDLALSYFLYSRGFIQEALIVFFVDYGTSLLNIMHFMTISLQNSMPLWITSLEIAMFFFLNPIAPGCCCFLWMIFSIQENQEMRHHYNFLSKLTCLINGAFESPAQIVLLLFFFVTGRLQPPWFDTTVWTDSLGNEIGLGSYLSIVSFTLGCLSLIKNVNDSYQCHQICDSLTVIAFIIPNILFRTFSFTILVAFIREWIMFLIVTLMLINFIIGIILKPNEKGINQASTMFCSIFCVVGIPNDPTIKDITGKSEVDPKMLKKMALIITISSVPVISGFCWATYAIYYKVGFNIDINILLTQEQQLFIMQVVLSAFTGLSFLSCMLFAVIFDNDKISNILKCFLNFLMVSLVSVTLVLCYTFFPVGPQPFVIPIRQVHGGVKIFEGLSGHVFTSPSLCHIHDRTSVHCENNKTFVVKFVPNILIDSSFDKDTFIVLDKGLDTSLEVLNGSDTFMVFPAEMKKQLKKEIENANCLLCNNPDSNRCRNLIFAHTICKTHCETTPYFIGNFTLDRARWLLKADNPENTPDGWSVESARVNVDKRNMNVKKIEVYCKAPKYFFNKSKAKKCHSNEFETECIVGEVKCSGNGKWILEPEELECRHPGNKTECLNISGYFSDGKCLGRPNSDEECKASGQGDLYDGKGHCHEADVLWLGENSAFSLPSFSRLDGCSIRLPPKKFDNSMLSFKDGNLMLCGGKTQHQNAVTACHFFGKEEKWSPSSSLAHARYFATITTLWDGSLWIAGGITFKDGTSTVIASSEVLTEKGWLVNASLPWPRSGHCSVSLGTDGVFVGGGSGTLGGKGSSTAAIFNSKESKFALIQDIPSAKKFASCAALDQKVYIGDESSGNISVYNLLSKSWQDNIPFKHQLVIAMFTYKQKIYVISQNNKNGKKTIFNLHEKSFIFVKNVDIRHSIGRVQHNMLYKALCN